MAKRRQAANHDPLRIQREEDAWNREFLRQFYERRRSEILQSGDTVRIRLLKEHDAREAQRG